MKTDLEFLKLQYQVLSDRQISHNAIVWNTPTLLFVAETLLWGLIFDIKDCHMLGLVFAAFSVIIAVASKQHFIRNRIMENADCAQLRAIEKYLKENAEDGTKVPTMLIHHKFDERTILADGSTVKLNEYMEETDDLYKKTWLGRKKTFYFWNHIMTMMIILSSAICLYKLSQVLGWIN